MNATTTATTPTTTLTKNTIKAETKNSLFHKARSRDLVICSMLSKDTRRHVTYQSICRVIQLSEEIFSITFQSTQFGEDSSFKSVEVLITSLLCSVNWEHCAEPLMTCKSVNLQVQPNTS